MPTEFSQTIKENRVFLSLPAWVQETIIQSGVELNSEEDLKACADNLMRPGQN